MDTIAKLGYKQTEIGEIPQEWDVLPLSKIVDERNNSIKRGPWGSSLKKSFFVSNGFKIYEQKNVIANNFSLGKYFINEEKFSELKDFEILPGDILISCSGTIGKITIVPENIQKGIMNQALLKLSMKRNLINNKYILNSLQSSSVQRRFFGLSHGSSIQNVVSIKTLKNIMFVIPPLSEQQKISSILSTVDDDIQQTDDIIIKTQQLKKGLMQQLLTRGIGHTKFKQTEIGEIPQEWEVVKLNDITNEFISGGTPSTSNPEYWDGEIPWMRSAWIKNRYIESGLKNITHTGLKNSATHIVPKNNLLVATRVSVGKVAVNKIDIAISQDLTGVILNKEMAYPEFYYWVLSNNQNKMKQLVQGSTITGIIRSDLKKLLIPLPSLLEQKKITSIISDIDNKVALETQKKLIIEKMKNSLMQVLLTGKVRVKVN